MHYLKRSISRNRFDQPLLYLYRDIEPKGFRLLTMDGFVTPSLAKRVKQVLEDQDLKKEIVDHNYEVSRQFYSYSVVRSNLRAFISVLPGTKFLSF